MPLWCRPGNADEDEKAMAASSLAQRRTGLSVVPVPEPDLTPRELIARAAALKPLLRAQQAENDERGTYSPELHEAFVKAGLYRTVQPRMFGGYEFDIPTFYRAMLEIAHGHPSAGWCLTLCASHPFLIASHWSERAQRELFGPDGHFAAPHRVPPMGTLTPVEGGYRLTGKWDYCSGIPYSTHLVCGALLPVAGAAPQAFCAAVPRDKLNILDDWGGDRTLGMRASGSNSVEIKDVFVPAHHVAPLQAMFTRPEDMRDGTPGARLHGNPMYLGRVSGPYHISLVTTVVGAAKASLDEFEDIIRSKKTTFPPVVPRAEHEDYQRSLGQATVLTDAAENLMIRGAEVYMEMCERWAADGTLITVEENLRLWAMMQQAGRMACDAVELLFKTAGTSVTRKGSRMERYFRDAQMYRVHPSALYENFWAPIGRAHLGLPIRHFHF
jgi:3-hydroxy-9,10-secoandrosta-1,3,5(10)-triene-9,17-dione monooxygenase